MGPNFLGGLFPNIFSKSYFSYGKKFMWWEFCEGVVVSFVSAFKQKDSH